MLSKQSGWDSKNSDFCSFSACIRNTKTFALDTTNKPKVVVFVQIADEGISDKFCHIFNIRALVGRYGAPFSPMNPENKQIGATIWAMGNKPGLFSQL